MGWKTLSWIWDPGNTIPGIMEEAPGFPAAKIAQKESAWSGRISWKCVCVCAAFRRPLQGGGFKDCLSPRVKWGNDSNSWLIFVKWVAQPPIRRPFCWEMPVPSMMILLYIECSQRFFWKRLSVITVEFSNTMNRGCLASFRIGGFWQQHQDLKMMVINIFLIPFEG